MSFFKKYRDDILSEHGEYSIKRSLIIIFSLAALYLIIFTGSEDGELTKIREVLFFITGLVIGAIANKHKSLSKSTNESHD